jgi:hypothetical protein
MKKMNRLLEQAKQGNVKVIAALMNRQLKAQGMMADISNEHDYLDILIESDRPSLTADYKVPNQEALVAMIKKWLLALEIRSIANVRVSWQLSGQEQPTWHQEFRLTDMAELNDMNDMSDAPNLSVPSSDRPLAQAEQMFESEHSSPPTTNQAQSTTSPDEIAAINEFVANQYDPFLPDGSTEDADLAADLAEIPSLEHLLSAESTIESGTAIDFDAISADYSRSSLSQDLNQIERDSSDFEDADDPSRAIATANQSADGEPVDMLPAASPSSSPSLVMQVAQFTALSVIVVLIMMGLNFLLGQDRSNSTDPSQQSNSQPSSKSSIVVTQSSR